MGLNADVPGLQVLLAGSSGLVGQHVLAGLLRRKDVARVIAVSRRPRKIDDARVLCVDSPLDSALAMDELDARLSRLAPQLDVYACCLGTTLRAAGSKQAFLAVDRDLVVRMGQSARKRGARHALLVSSVGASAQSGNFYLRVKGEAERLLAGQGFDRVDVLRPGLLLGARSESRPGEAFAQRLAPWLNPVLLGPLRRYRSIPAETVAAALVSLIGSSAAGVHVHANDALQQLADAA